MPRRKSATKPKSAAKLEKLGFYKSERLGSWEAPSHLKDKALFMTYPKDEVTFALDETGQVWKSDRIVDLAPHKFLDLRVVAVQ